MDSRSEGEWLLFEIGSLRHALPVQAVAEVTEPGPTAAIPTVDPRYVRAVCHHGEPLPLLLKRGWSRTADRASGAPARHWIVIVDEAGNPQLALEADRVVGLAGADPEPGEPGSGSPAAAASSPLRRLSVADLLARARERIEAGGRGDARREREGEP